MKFSYKKFASGVLRPVIPVELECNGKTLLYEALVDSGADACIFDAEIGELLGIDVESGEKLLVGGITGNTENYYVHHLTMKIGGWSYKIKAGFLPNIAKIGYGVLGQKGFFDLFIVKFDLLKEEIELKERK